MSQAPSVWTWYENQWHAGDVRILGAGSHATWLGSLVFDGARRFEGVIPDLDLHAERVNASARALGLPVVSTLQYPERMGDMIPEILEALPGDEPRPGKTRFSSCGCGAFCDRLAEIAKDTVLICGVETHICVSQTAHDLLAGGYKVHVAADAVSSRAKSNWKIGLEKMRPIHTIRGWGHWPGRVGR